MPDCLASASPDTTCMATSGALTRAAMRAARRMTDAFPGAPVTATMIRSVVSHTSPPVPLERRYSSSSSSASSATKRSDSSRRATRFSARKKPDERGGNLRLGIDVAVKHAPAKLIRR